MNRDKIKTIGKTNYLQETKINFELATCIDMTMKMLKGVLSQFDKSQLVDHLILLYINSSVEQIVNDTSL